MNSNDKCASSCWYTYCPITIGFVSHLTLHFASDTLFIKTGNRISLHLILFVRNHSLYILMAMETIKEYRSSQEEEIREVLSDINRRIRLQVHFIHYYTALKLITFWLPSKSVLDFLGNNSKKI
jgi:hypothetical protein